MYWNTECVPHRGRVVAADAHIATSVAGRSHFVALDLLVILDMEFEQRVELPYFGARASIA
jgi:hypothetical protein